MTRAILAIGTLLLAFPAVVHADALSPWVQNALDRMDAGISAAGTFGPEPSCNNNDKDGLIAEAQAAVRDYIDVRQQISRHNGYLRENTVCYQSDLNLLEDKIHEVREAMVDAVQTCSSTRMRTLREVFAFGSDAYRLLALSGNDPSASSDLLRYEYLWEDAGLLAAGTGGGLTDKHADAPLCPFTTDFAPRSIGYTLEDWMEGDHTLGKMNMKSYGCDAETMRNLQWQTAETSSTADFFEATDAFGQQLAAIVSAFENNINATIAALRGTSPNTEPLPPPTTLPHAELTGCLRPQFGRVTSKAGMPWDSFYDDYPNYYNEENMRILGSLVTFDPPPELALPIGLFLRPAYDYFAEYSNAISMSRRLTAKRTLIGNERPLPVRAQGRGEGFDTSMFLFIYGTDAAAQYRTISASIDRQTGFLEGASRDAIERTMDGFLPLQEAVTDLSIVAEEELPKYIQDFGFFMLRQCVNGHCSAVDGTLDTMMKRIYNPYCHPYVSGAYKSARTHIMCFCITKDEDPDGLDLDGCDCLNPGSSDCQHYCAYCQTSPTQEEIDEFNDKEPELFPGCRVEHGDPDTGY